MTKVAVGEAAWRLDLPVGVSAPEARARLVDYPGVLDVVVSERHVLVVFDPQAPPLDVDSALGQTAEILRSPEARPTHVVGVRYNGLDLAQVSTWSGLPVEDVVRLHTSREYQVRVVGFLPGFAYLGEVDPRIAAPRLPSPRDRVTALSVGIAGARTGIYPCASPGGWNLLGTAVGFVAFDPERGPGLHLGDRVRFEAV